VFITAEMGAVGLEPTCPRALDFESSPSTNSGTLPQAGAYAARLGTAPPSLTRVIEAPTALSLASRWA
jgi:hypothetical protein